MIDLKETEIRPDTLKSGQDECVAADIHWLNSRRSQFIEVGCPACDSADHRPAFTKNGMNYVTCEVCETVFINPRATPEMLGEFYASSANYAYWNKYIFPASEAARKEKIFRPRAERLAEFVGESPVEPAAEISRNRVGSRD